MNWEPRALHNKPSPNEHSKVIFTPIILSQKYFLQGPSCTHREALIVLSRTYPVSYKNKNTIKLICSVCCISRAGQAALNASALRLSQVTNLMLPPLAPKPQPRAAATDTAAVVSQQGSLGCACCAQGALLWWFFWTSQGISTPLSADWLLAVFQRLQLLLWTAVYFGKTHSTGQGFSLTALEAHLM